MKLWIAVIRVMAAILVVAFLLFTVVLTCAQTTIMAPAPVATARIPFDFWIGGSHLPAGDYTVEFILNSLVLFRNAQGNAQEHAFLMPTGKRAESRDCKIVFVARNRRYYLQELWNTNGKSVFISHIAERREDIRREIFTGAQLGDTSFAGRESFVKRGWHSPGLRVRSRPLENNGARAKVESTLQSCGIKVQLFSYCW